jgi:hypothetical protein
VNPANGIANYYAYQAADTQQREAPQVSHLTREPLCMAPHIRSESLGTWPARPFRNVLLKPKSMTSLSDELLNFSGLRRRASFASTNSAFASHYMFGSSGEAGIVSTTKEPTLKGQHRNEGIGFVYELVVPKRSRARLDSLFDYYSVSSEGEVFQGSPNA